MARKCLANGFMGPEERTVVPRPTKPALMTIFSEGKQVTMRTDKRGCLPGASLPNVHSWAHALEHAQEAEQLQMEQQPWVIGP